MSALKTEIYLKSVKMNAKKCRKEWKHITDCKYV